MTTSISDLIEQYAQRTVEDMDMDDLMNAVKESIIERMEDLPEPEALEEIRESSYSSELDLPEEEEA
jgi:hypothetical protein